jgi:acyl-CoA reductase-like NAD-dependent aldehyde dehydrogenase
MAKEYLMYIDGMWAKSSTLETIEVRNPYNGSLFARVQKGSREDAKTAVDAAFSAKDSWAETLAVERADYLYRLRISSSF